jgi:hypothetical protein
MSPESRETARIPVICGVCLRHYSNADTSRGYHVCTGPSYSSLHPTRTPSGLWFYALGFVVAFGLALLCSISLP